MGNISQEQILTKEQQEEQKTRLKNVIKYLKQTGKITGVPMLAKTLYIPEDTINSWIKKPNKSGVSKYFIEKLCQQYPELNKDYLLPPFLDNDIVPKNPFKIVAKEEIKKFVGEVEILKIIELCTGYDIEPEVDHWGEELSSIPIPKMSQIHFISKDKKKYFTITEDLADQLFIQVINAIRLSFNGMFSSKGHSADYMLNFELRDTLIEMGESVLTKTKQSEEKQK